MSGLRAADGTLGTRSCHYEDVFLSMSGQDYDRLDPLVKQPLSCINHVLTPYWSLSRDLAMATLCLGGCSVVGGEHALQMDHCSGKAT